MAALSHLCLPPRHGAPCDLPTRRVWSRPGAQQQLLHTEQQAFVYHLKKTVGLSAASPPHPTLILASITAISEMSKENGGTLIVPGSHRWSRRRKPQPHEVVSIAMPAGSTVYWLGSTMHAAGANTTADEWREAFFISWSVGWLRQETNQYLEIPHEVAAKLEPGARAVLGYSNSDTLGGYDRRFSGAPRAARYPKPASKL